MKSRLFNLSLLVLLGAFAFNTAMAGGADTSSLKTGYMTVSYADLNLASSSGLDVLYLRIKSAAHKVCGVENMRVPLDLERRNRACVDSAIDGAVNGIDDVRLTHLHQARLAEDRQS